MVQHVITKIQHAACDAVETLREIVRDPEKPASARATAARTIIDMAMKGLEYEDLLSRIEALEEYIGERK